MAGNWWKRPDPETWADFLEVCMPLYSKGPVDTDVFARVIQNYKLCAHWSRPEGEATTFNFLPDLKRVNCPTLIIAGVDDPVCPIEDVEELAAALPPKFLHYHRLADCRHGVVRDAGGVAMDILREFITS